MKISLTRTVGVQIAGVFGLTAFLYWAAWVWPTLPFGFGSAIFVGIGFLLPVASAAAAIAMVLAVVDVLRKGHRAQAAQSLGFLVAVIAGTAVGMLLGPVQKMQRIRCVAQSAMPLVRSIEAFERNERRPPHDLSELVPRYIPAIPSTGMWGYSAWDYIRGTGAQTYSENSWVLLVHTGGPGINFDQLMYFPNQHYPEFGHGGWIERIGAWGYVHE